MITFCTGNTALKRKSFRSMTGEGVVSVDNDEVLATFTLDKKLYAVVGDIPYSNMTLEQYIACSRALKTNLPLKREAIKNMLSSAGLKFSPRRSMSKLSRIEYRMAAVVSKLDLDTRTVFINFDGLEYSRKNKNEFNKFLANLSKKYEIFAAVSDSRFVPKKATALNYTSDGIEPRKVKEYTRLSSKSAFKRKLVKSGMDIALPKVRKVTVADCV